MLKRGFRPSNLLFITLLVTLSALILARSFTTGFRIDADNIDLAWQANSARLMVLFAAGFAQCAGLAALKSSVSLLQHIRLYLCVVITCAAIIASSIMSMPMWSTVLMVMAVAIFTFYLSGKIEFSTSFARLILGLVLYAVFFLSIAVYFAASTQSDDVYGGMVLWLLSSADISSHSASYVVASVIVLLAALMTVKDKEFVAIGIIAISVGLVGPLVFLGYFAFLVLPPEMGLRCKILAAGLLGGTFIVAASSLTQFLFGGYAPVLIVPLAFVFIPLVLLNSARTAQSTGSTTSTVSTQSIQVLECVLLALVAFISIAVVVHINQYAQGLI